MTESNVNQQQLLQQSAHKYLFLDNEGGFLSIINKGVRNSVDFDEIPDPRASYKDNVAIQQSAKSKDNIAMDC